MQAPLQHAVLQRLYIKEGIKGENKHEERVEIGTDERAERDEKPIDRPIEGGSGRKKFRVEKNGQRSREEGGGPRFERAQITYSLKRS